LKYLGIHIVCSRGFKCSLTAAKRSFYKTANAVFGKIGGRSSEDVILQLIRSKCMPALLYGLEACPFRLSDYNSLDFVVNRFFMKLFKTNNLDTVTYCRTQFNFDLPSTVLKERSDAFVRISCVTTFLYCCTERCLDVYCLFFMIVFFHHHMMMNKVAYIICTLLEILCVFQQ